MRSYSILPIVLLATAAVALLRAQDATPTFRTNANIVVVPVVVKDDAGRFVFGLTSQDFEISDDGKPREIKQFDTERVPVSLGILLDISGSMSQDPRNTNDKRWADTRRAFELLLTRIVPDDELFFSAFRDNLIPAVPWTHDHHRVLDAFQALAPGGNSELFSAVSLVSPMFAAAEHRRKVLLLISDGQDSGDSATVVTANSRFRNRSARDKREAEDDIQWQIDSARRQRLSSARQAINQSEALMYAVGIGTRRAQSVDAATLGALANGTGGYVEVVGDPSDISAAIARICDDLRAQYVLGFEALGNDGNAHKIAVKVKRRGVRVRARNAYVAHQ
jgi:Ca-activated chloride channel family protein